MGVSCHVAYTYRHTDTALGWYLDNLLNAMKELSPELQITEVQFTEDKHEFIVWFSNSMVRGYTIDHIVKAFTMPEWFKHCAQQSLLLGK